MEEIIEETIEVERPFALVSTRGGNQAYRILHLGYAAAPILAGLDKFLERLVEWEQYLAPQIGHTPRARRRIMRAVGCVEIAAGALVAVKPRIGGWVVAGWLGGIIGNLMLGRRSYDVALRDFGLMLGAVALARLAAGRAEVEAPTVH